MTKKSNKEKYRRTCNQQDMTYREVIMIKEIEKSG